MKKEIHPKLNKVIFADISSDFKMLSDSVLSSAEKMKWQDGNEYPVVKVEISSESHPFYSGVDSIIDTEGRVEKFNKKFKLKK